MPTRFPIRLAPVLISILLLGPMAGLRAQPQHGGSPAGLAAKKPLEAAHVRRFPALDMAKIAEEDAQWAAAHAGSELTGRVRPLHEDFFALAQRDPHPAGGSLFRARLEADDARALSLYWDTFQLVPGARLFVYTPGGEQIRGAFTTENNADGGPFALSRLRGEAVILEVHEPNTPMDAAPQSRLVLNGLGHLYAPSLATGGSGKSFGSSDPCEINVNCGEGDDFRDPQRAVLQMEIRVNSTKVGECTVTLVNNTALDGRNYVLGAEHCALDPNGNFVPPSILQQWIFYFNYEAPGCNTPAFEGSLADQSMVGAQLRARSDGDGGEFGSDFMLLELLGQIPASYNAFYAGWTRTPNPIGVNGVGIHHPGGDIKKISTIALQPTSTQWSSDPTFTAQTHWRITWGSTTNGHGVTEGGSSGSAVFTPSGQVFGTLTGGSSFCSDPFAPDLYGKFSYHWESNGSTPNRQLAPWLDPVGAQPLSFSGMDASAVTSRPAARSGPGGSAKWQLYPNPAADELQLAADLQGEFQLAVHDLQGRRLLQRAIRIAPGRPARLNLPARLPNGLYVLRVQGPEVNRNFKFQLQRP